MITIAFIIIQLINKTKHLNKANKIKCCQGNKYIFFSLHFSVIDYDLKHLWRSSFDPEANSMERIAKFSSSTASATESFIEFRSRRVRLVCHPSEAPSFLAYSALMDYLETIPCGSSGTRVSHGRLVLRRKWEGRKKRKRKRKQGTRQKLASWI